ncbi:MAG: xanthine dehydrogenase family protein subunit M [Rhodospirillales bacterium]|nr:xanthine dehydrogenase family protein subunit M [Rhodospirillales bacterium]MDH3911372.1 xanthine dehydrogenase family protein subunit M [Rhodospirillales bacterium]MDH3919116.1 xanthine dehydrogenase family protein subunit M [Rhodospirillales bacterium]MDH3967870.1 xanthine dehydrogenase family protein subunit M [Rhodospirillales bacterium]
MIPGAFEYHRPTSVDEAIALMSQHGDEGRVIAGGHSLIPMMKLRLAEPGHLIDLRDLDSLRGIQPAGRCIEIGAMTTQQEVAVSELLAEACPILREAALLIADPQVRYCGTLGGNVANGDPGNDMPAVMQCLDASFVLRGPQGEREVRARDFYEAAYFTARAEDELVTAVSIPIPPAGHGYAYEKLKRKVGDYATAAAAVVLTMSGGSCESASIALTNVGQTPLFAEAAGQALVGTKVDEAAVARAVEAAKDIAEPVADMRGPEEYRTHVTGVMVRRAVERALTRARA